MSELYKCYSIRLKKFLGANGIRYISKGFNNETNRRFWIYLKTPQVCELLEIYTETFTKQREVAEDDE